MNMKQILKLMALRVAELKREYPCVMENLRIKFVNCGRSMFHVCCGRGMVRVHIEADRKPVPDELVCTVCGRHFTGNVTS